MANLAELILDNRAQLTTLIAAYDAETAGAEMEYHRRLAQAEAHRRTETDAARGHFEEALDRLGLTMFTVRPAADDPLSGMVLQPHLPEPLPLSDLVQKEKYRNGIGEAEPEAVGECAVSLPDDNLADATRGGSRPEPGQPDRPALRCPKPPGHDNGLSGICEELPGGGAEQIPAHSAVPAPESNPAEKTGGVTPVGVSTTRSAIEPQALICPDCGKEKSPTANRCRSCAISHGWKTRQSAGYTKPEAGSCTDCGKALQRPGAVRCKPCSNKFRFGKKEQEIVGTSATRPNGGSPIAEVTTPPAVRIIPTIAPVEDEPDLSTTPALAPSAPVTEGDIPDYLPAVSVANRLPAEQKAALNAEIHQGVATYRPGRFEIHQDAATGAFFCVPYRHKEAQGCRAVLWIQYHNGKAFPTFFPQKVGK